MAALNKGLGKPSSEKLLGVCNSCLISSHSELRLRRPDLSSKMSQDPQSFAKLVGESRVLRSIAVHVRPGHAADFESLGRQRPRRPHYYIGFLRNSLGGMDQEPTLKGILGEEGLARFENSIAESTAYGGFRVRHLPLPSRYELSTSGNL